MGTENKIQLLDCTLRDGGYINDWNFGERTIKSIIASLIRSNIDFVEIGFLRDCVYDKDKTLYNNVAEAKNNMYVTNNTGNTRFILMSLHNQYNLDKLEESDGSIYAIRVTFHDYDINEGLEYIRKVKDKNYRVFCNPINIMGYSDYQILELIEKVNDINPFGFSIVDTFGSMKHNDLMRLYHLCENNLSHDIILGLHLHENMSMSFSLAQTFINIASHDRKCIIDGSLFGMGRVPGNLHIELIMDYLNKLRDAKYVTSYLLDAIDNHILHLKLKESWGYSTEYYLSAKYNLHRNYSEYLLNKGKLTSKSINHILSQIEKHKKTAFDVDYIEQLYLKYQDRAFDDSCMIDSLKSQIGKKEILILAPGKSLDKEKGKIQQFMNECGPFVFSANFYNDLFYIDKAFFSNAKRFESQNFSQIKSKILLTSNINTGENTEYDKTNYHDAYYGQIITGNCVLMLINLILRMGFSKIYLAGFDGYAKNEDFYMDKSFDSVVTERNAETSNKEIAGLLSQLRQHIHIEFITASLYDII